VQRELVQRSAEQHWLETISHHWYWRCVHATRARARKPFGVARSGVGRPPIKRHRPKWLLVCWWYGEHRAYDRTRLRPRRLIAGWYCGQVSVQARLFDPGDPIEDGLRVCEKCELEFRIEEEQVRYASGE
jgi:hypothetical protein